MSEQNGNKNKIGARYLSDMEAELILPTYQRIYQQIDQFRREKGSQGFKKQSERNRDNSQKGSDLDDGQDKDQKTNNIGIIGVRGAGKTSVLKTIRVRLEKDKRDRGLNDIILPIIVPENMSESSTLMATVLGMLSEVIKDKDEEEQKNRKGDNEDCIRKSPLRISCDKAIKQYTYIQKEYRNILIQQYTTENDYVNRSARVFNSDTEFINMFIELINELLEVKKKDGSLLFIFIDDIDLSTSRCADVVKTLLSYLSNENIVTFISGDLETFEEALTLDFIRQDKVLNGDILDKKVGSGTLLASRKKLAYEYLKKIVPPAYRYNIKNWSLEEKGNYCIVDSEANQEEASRRTKQDIGRQKAGTTLSDLLLQALEGWVDPAFFRYGEHKYDTEEEEKNGNEDTGEKGSVIEALPYTYHLFDNTSRGLNNVYNVLNEIAAARKEGERDWSKEKKLLLDTIISSKAVYNSHRNDIQQNFFRVGATKPEGRVFLDNAKFFIYEKDAVKEDTVKEHIVKNDPNVNQEHKEQGTYRIKDPVERFSLFLLVDFAARLLYEKTDYEKKIREEKGYQTLKEKAMEDLFFHPVVAERVMDVSDYSWENTYEAALKKEAMKKGLSDFPELKDMKLKYVNSSFLLKGDLVLNLAYYKNLPLEGMLKLYDDSLQEESGREKFAGVELEQSAVIAMWKAFSSIAEVNASRAEENGLEGAPRMIAKYYSVFWKEFTYIRNRLSSSVVQNMAMRLFDDEINDVAGMDEKKSDQPVPEDGQEKRKEIIQMQRILSNTLAKALKAQDEDAVQEKIHIPQFNGVFMLENSKEERWIEAEDDEKKDMERRVKVLNAIDSGGLWHAEAAWTAVAYLKRVVRRYLRFIKKCLEDKKGDWVLDTIDADDDWREFEKPEFGKTMTIARRTRRIVKHLLEESNASFQQGMSLEIYREVVKNLEGLAGNSRVWYGQSEAQKILNELQKASARPDTDDRDWDTWIQKHSYFMFFLHCLYKYKMEAEQNKDIAQKAHLLAEISKELSVANVEADKQTLEDFITEVNKILKDEEFDSECFERLFAMRSEGK